MSNTVPSKGSWSSELGSPEFPVESGRYHLYIGLFCPFAHRAFLTRELKGLKDFMSVSVVKPFPKDGEG